MLTRIAPSSALYIKLGDGGKWERECIERGLIRFGYDEIPIDAAAAGDWTTVLDMLLTLRKQDKGSATRDLAQVKAYFLANERTLWITFFESKLWWCFAAPGVDALKGGRGSTRTTIDGWRDHDRLGNQLTCDRLTGGLLKVQGFRGTVCRVKEFEYLVRKINGDALPEVERAIDARKKVVEAIVPLVRGLTPLDFELLVDLVFSNSGWRRVSAVGKTQRQIDMELVLPTTGQRAYVQVKSYATNDDLAEHIQHIRTSDTFSRLFFVYHSSDHLSADDYGDDVTVIDAGRLARMIFDAGLTSWLIDKRS